MSLSISKLLATTAMLAAVSGVALADTVSTSTAGPLQTSTVVGGLDLIGDITISGTTTAAIEISATAATGAVSNTVNIGEGVTVQGSDSTSGTIMIMADQDGVVTINNSGTISAIGGNATAINASEANITGAITLRNTGTISGSVNTSDTADVIENSGTITGDVDMLAGADEMTLSGDSLINGNVDLGDDNDSLTITGGTVSGTIDGGNGTDNMYVSGSTFTTGGGITNIEGLHISSTVNLNHGTSGHLTDVTVGNGATLNINEDQQFAAGGAVDIDGTMNIAAGKVVSTTTADFTGGTLGIAIADSSTSARIDVASTGGSFTGGSLTISIDSNAGYIASGTEFRIVSSTASGAAILPSLTTATYGLYTFQVSLTNDSQQDVSLTVLRADTSTAATTSGNANIANVLDGISTTTNTELLAIQGLVSSQDSLSGVNNVLESLNPATDTGAALASVDVGVATGNQISTRLAMLRGGQTGINTGSGMFSNHFWVEGFGKISDQDAVSGAPGYDATTAGASFGMDTDSLMDGATTGLAFSYGATSVDSDNVNNAQTDVNSYLITGYASRVNRDGTFVNGQLNIGFNDYETERTIGGVGVARADFNGMQYGAKVEAGKDFAWDWMTLTPAVSAQYTYVDMDDYTETGAGGANLVVDSQSFNAFDLGAGAELAWNVPLESGGTLRPALRLKYIYRAGDDSIETNSRFVGGGAAFTTQGVEADRSSINAGAGLLLSSVGGVDLSLDYDADIRESYVGHTGQVKVRWAF